MPSEPLDPDYQPPSKNPTDAAAGIVGMLNIVLKKAKQKTDGQLPAVVISYDPVKNRARVQPQIMLVGEGGALVPRAPVAEVPVLSLTGGNFALRFPLRAGDLGWIEASDRDISLFLQSAGKQVKPGTERMFSFSDGRFIPDSFSRAVVGTDNQSRVVLQTLDGSVYIALGDDGAYVKGKFEVDGPVIMKQGVTVTGGATIDSIPFGTHKHDNVQPGTGNSGGPIA